MQIDGLAAKVRNCQVVDRTINWHEIELTNWSVRHGVAKARHTKWRAF